MWCVCACIVMSTLVKPSPLQGISCSLRNNYSRERHLTGDSHVEQKKGHVEQARFWERRQAFFCLHIQSVEK